MASAGLREVRVAEKPWAGEPSSDVEQEGWNLLFAPVLLDDVAMPILRQEYEAAERAVAQAPAPCLPNAETDIDREFEAILKMKTDPLKLTHEEAEVYTRLRERRASPVAKALPLE